VRQHVDAALQEYMPFVLRHNPENVSLPNTKGESLVSAILSLPEQHPFTVAAGAQRSVMMLKEFHYWRAQRRNWPY
jgi:hypothetical protein